MDRFESLQVIKSRQAELVAEKRETSSKRRQYKTEHQTNESDYALHFHCSDDIRNGLRETLRNLHLAACFLRGTPYHWVEETPRENEIPSAQEICGDVKELCGIELDPSEVQIWKKSWFQICKEKLESRGAQ